MTPEPVPPRPDGAHPLPEPAEASSGEGLGGRPRATWGAGEAIAVYVLALVIASFAVIPVVRLIADEDLAGIVASLVAALAITGVLLAWLSSSHRSWRQVLGLPEPGRWWREIRASIGFGLLLYPAMVFAVGIVVSVVLSTISGQSVRAPEQVPSGLSLMGAVVTSVYAVVVAPIHEELFFRGILFRAVRDRHGLAWGLLATGIGFSLIHYIPSAWQDTLLLMGVMFFNGMALAWWYARRATIVAPIVAHVVFNVIGLSLIFAVGAAGPGR